ncbi:sugar ABC transporter ATP-binding protein [Kineococcus aurantiacus]|uniref:ABC-type sugar transport system ATPase subunit n=1 Tax=Kineococcus aurantiacus TaxID=37633 RepID=A0A7Y9DQR1_9ACTN|nr:sugar ABC transporter ATP-binding protein [Kineococcus aurantiacus]NYD25091.1 ABC-type sugar transport system ATPase subunit [Kineococcus aurantiacus]
MPSAEPPLLEVEGLGKSFNGVPALSGISFSLQVGQVLGLAGHNGAGKSTLLNLLSGVFAPDTGQMRICGRSYAPRGYGDATATGVFRIYQELSVIDNLTVAENITLGSERYVRRAGFLLPSVARTRVAEFLASIALTDIEPRRRVGDLSMAEKQLVEIAKALYMAHLRGFETPVLLLDEPTSGLTQSQVDFLESRVNAMRHRMGVILTTHRGSELLDWSDRVLVLREGVDVGEPDPATTTPEELAELMVGEARVNTYTRLTDRPDGEPVLEVRDLDLPSLSEAFDVTVHAGEVVALVGESEEKSDIVRCIAGLDHADGGTISVGQHRLRHDVRAHLAAGIRFVPADRGGEGLALMHPVRTNLTAEAIAVEGRGDLARRPRAEVSFAQELVERYSVKVASLEQQAGSLSGGNQQKLLVARVLSDHARVVVLDKPTRGIDVHAKSEIYRLVVEASGRGTAVVIASDEPEELLPICDRMVVLRDGAVRAVFDCRNGQNPNLSELV